MKRITSVTTYVLCLAMVVGLVVACHSSAKPNNETSNLKTDIEGTSLPAEIETVDTGQAYFKVVCTKDNLPLHTFEGVEPTAIQLDTFFTVALALPVVANKWVDNLDIKIYIKKMAAGNYPVVGILYSRDGKATMLLTSPKEEYSSQPKEGLVTITKITDSTFSGKFAGTSITHEGNKMGIHGVFLNVKYK